jgi:hypothetical protein
MFSAGFLSVTTGVVPIFFSASLPQPNKPPPNMAATAADAKNNFMI